MHTVHTGHRLSAFSFLFPSVTQERVTGMEDEGLFRRSPNSALLQQVKEAYDRGICLSPIFCLDFLIVIPLGNVVSMETFGDPHLAAVLLKKYIRDLPSPIFPESMYATIRQCPQPTSDPSDITSITYIRDNILSELAPCVYILLSHILRE